MISILERLQQILKNEQRTNKSLANCWSLAERDKTGYFVKDGIIYRHQKLYNFDYEQLMLPFGRRAEVMKMTHDTAGCNLGAKKTKEKIKFSFTWPTIASDVQKVCECCHKCKKRRRPRCMIGLRSHLYQGTKCHLTV